MKIYLIEKDYERFKYLIPYFSDLEEITLVHDDFKSFISGNKVQCVVSPANAFGLMDGGFDLALTDWYGIQLQERVQQYIIEKFWGEQPVGTSFIIDTNKDNQKLIHTPTMRIPQKIKDESVIYQCMRTTLITAMENNIESIVIPMFGGLAGGVRPQTVARIMRLAYDQLQNTPRKIDWDYAERIKL